MNIRFLLFQKMLEIQVPGDHLPEHLASYKDAFKKHCFY